VSDYVKKLFFTVGKKRGVYGWGYEWVWVEGKRVKRWGLGVPGANFASQNGSPSTTAELTSLRTGGSRLCLSREPTAVGGVPCGGLKKCPLRGRSTENDFPQGGKTFYHSGGGAVKTFPWLRCAPALPKIVFRAAGGLSREAGASQLKSDFASPRQG